MRSRRNHYFVVVTVDHSFRSPTKYRWIRSVCVYSFYYIRTPVDKPQLSYIVTKVQKTLSYKKDVLIFMTNGVIRSSKLQELKNVLQVMWDYVFYAGLQNRE